MIFEAIFGALSGQGVCTDSSGYIAGAGFQSAAIIHDATLWAGVQAAMMYWQRETNSTISDIRQNLANRRIVMAEAAFEHAKLVWDKESALVSETMASATATPEYGRAYIFADYVENGWQYTDASFDARTAKLGLTVNQCDDNRTARGMAIAKVDLMANAMRAGEARALQLNDRRFSQQLSVLGLGRNRLTTAMKIGQLGTAGQMAVSNAVTSAFNQAMGTWGYENNRWRAEGSSQWRDRGTRTAAVAPIEDRSVRWTPDEVTPKTIYVQQENQDIQSLVESETPPI